MGYRIEVEAADNSRYGGTAPDVASMCTSTGGSNYCSWPISDAVKTLMTNKGLAWQGCLATEPVVHIAITDLNTNEIYYEDLDVGGINYQVVANKVFTITYKGDYKHTHNIRAWFDDCCVSFGTDTRTIPNPNVQGCNDGVNQDLNTQTGYNKQYAFDKNKKVTRITIMNSDGDTLGNQSKNSDCASSSFDGPCYDMNFS